jgi:hypothetical protein
VLGPRVEVAFDAVIDQGDEAGCDDDTGVVRWEELEVSESLTRLHL